MRKKWIKRIIAAGLTLSMLAGLTACGNRESSGSNAGNSGGKNNSNTELAKQYVFQEQALEIPDVGDNFNVRLLSQSGDRVYALLEISRWTEGLSETEMKLVSWKNDGTDMQVSELELTMGGSETASQDETASVGSEEPEAGDSSAVNVLEGDAAVSDAVMEPAVVNSYSYTGVSQCVLSPDGVIYGIKNHSEEDYSDPENYVSKNENYVCSWSLEGKMQWETALEDLQTEESWSYVQALVPMPDGGAVLLLSGDQMEKIVLGADGSLSPRTPLSDSSSILSNVSNLLVNSDGTLTAVYWNNDDNYSLYMAAYDVEKDTFSEGVRLPDSIAMSGYNTIVAGIDTDLIYTNSSGVFSYNMGDEQPRQILSYVNSDMSTTSMYNVLAVDDTHLVGFYYDSYTGETHGGFFTKVNPEDIPDKSVIVLAGNYVDYELRNRVVDFNKSSDLYRIVIKEYQQYGTTDNYMAGYTQLNNDILSGNMPDILIADNNIPIENYVSKGLIADVGELIAQDEELSQTEFMENVFDAYRINDKLYYVIPSFSVRTMIAKKSLVGDRTSWTMQDMQEVVAGMPEGSQGIGDIVRSGFLSTMMQYCGNDFVDVSTGKCNFNSPDFISMLNYANGLPEEFGEDYWGEDYWMTYQSQYRDNKTLLMECYISSARDMVRNINGYFGEEISYVGFPTESGNGSVVVPNQKYAISAKSGSQEGAWEFLRYYLTDEYQNTLQWALPISRDVFIEKTNEAMENPYYLDENGEKVEYEDTMYINDEEIKLANLTQEQADEFVAFVESVDKAFYYNESIQNIITEEAAAFFEGQKSAEDVAAVIQSRVQIYVNENR